MNTLSLFSLENCIRLQLSAFLSICPHLPPRLSASAHAVITFFHCRTLSQPFIAFRTLSHALTCSHFYGILSVTPCRKEFHALTSLSCV